MPDAFRNYLTQIESAYKAGNATEHTCRPALRNQLEAVASGALDSFPA